VLLALLEHPGTVVSRKDLQERLWPADTHVEFENGLNNAISRLREALKDSAESPRFVETVPRRGYRFIGSVETVDTAIAVPSPDTHNAPAPEAVGGRPLDDEPAVARPEATPGRAWRLRAAVIAGVILVAAAAWWAARPAHPLDSVAVLPFVTRTSGDSTDDYVAFGMTDAIIAELSRVDVLSVISQTSSLRYRGTTKSLPEIARELGVGAVVEGSVVREGSQLRITVQLIDAARDTHLWADTYRRDAEDLLATQGDLAREIARAIRLELTGLESAPSGASRAVDPRVRQAYLKGRYFMSLGTEDGRARALTFFEEAVALDADHAPSHAGVADYFTPDRQHADGDRDSARPCRGRACARPGPDARRRICLTRLPALLRRLGLGGGRASVRPRARFEPHAHARPPLVRTVPRGRRPERRSPAERGAGPRARPGLARGAYERRAGLAAHPAARQAARSGAPHPRAAPAQPGGLRARRIRPLPSGRVHRGAGRAR
jgi:TolB-like protein